jgi:hypothetical protein
MPRRRITKRFVEDGRGIKNLTHNPSSNSRLGDIGYVDETGSWRRIVNILDQTSCDPLRIKCLLLARGIPQYITQTKYIPFDEPVIELYNGGGCQIVTGDELARYTL